MAESRNKSLQTGRPADVSLNETGSVQLVFSKASPIYTVASYCTSHKCPITQCQGFNPDLTVSPLFTFLYCIIFHCRSYMGKSQIIHMYSGKDRCLCILDLLSLLLKDSLSPSIYSSFQNNILEFKWRCTVTL